MRELELRSTNERGVITEWPILKTYKIVSNHATKKSQPHGHGQVSSRVKVTDFRRRLELENFTNSV